MYTRMLHVTYYATRMLRPNLLILKKLAKSLVKSLKISSLFDNFHRVREAIVKDYNLCISTP